MYYFYAYFRYLDARGIPELEAGKDAAKVYFCVPTGNFGNALAGFYARCMGLPIERLVVATNHNDIIYRFMQHGDYSARPVRPSLGKAWEVCRFLLLLRVASTVHRNGNRCFPPAFF